MDDARLALFLADLATFFLAGSVRLAVLELLLLFTVRGLWPLELFEAVDELGVVAPPPRRLLPTIPATAPDVTVECRGLRGLALDEDNSSSDRWGEQDELVFCSLSLIRLL